MAIMRELDPGKIWIGVDPGGKGNFGLAILKRAGLGNLHRRIGGVSA
jgi:hypothetical protein